MQITKAEVTSTELMLRQPVRMARLEPIASVTAVFVRLETLQGQNVWGCAVAHPDLTGERPQDLIRKCQACADKIIDLHPINIEYTLAELTSPAQGSPAALGAFDIALHDLLGLFAGLPLYRLLGGYRNKIQTSATIPASTVRESVALARERTRQGFRMLKIKGGSNPDEDVHRVRAIHRAFPKITLRLDPDGCYTVQESLDVARALASRLEMLEQPTPADDLEGLRQVKNHSPVPVLADQSVGGPASALNIATQHIADGMSVKVATCGGLRCARQIDTIARAAQLSTMVSCYIEPTLLIAAGLSLALSSPNVRYADLDGNLDLLNDPSTAGFILEEGWLIASDVPGLGSNVQLG